MKVWIETERLFLRPLTPEDAEAVFRWGGDPAVNTYMIYPLYHAAEEVRRWLESRNPDDPDAYDEGIALKSTGELIGSGGLTFHPERNSWEIGYNLRADQWGHGYTGEMLTGLMAYIRQTRRIAAIDGVFAAENSKSRRVMEKLGMAWVRDTTYSKLDGSRTYPAKYYRRDFPLPEDAGEITVRPFRESDAQAVSDLVRTALLVSCAGDYEPGPLRSFADTQTPARMLDRGRTTHFLVAETAGVAVGCGAIGTDSEVPDEGCIYSLYVAPDCQGRGIGRRLMETLAADEYGRQARRLTVHASRTALGFYRKLGFACRNGCDSPDGDGLFLLEKAIEPLRGPMQEGEGS